jgi:hypothetical protein
MKNVCMEKYPEHKPVCEVITTRYMSEHGLQEIDQKYWYCERCNEILDPPEKEEDGKIPF